MGVKSPKRSKGNSLSSLKLGGRTILIRILTFHGELTRSLLVILDSLDPFSMDTYLRLKGFWGVAKLAVQWTARGYQNSYNIYSFSQLEISGGIRADTYNNNLEAVYR